MCDPQCINYDDCCRDADALYGEGESYGKLVNPEGGFSCRPVPPLSKAPKEASERSWYMKDACPKEVTAAARRECEQPRSASSDPLASVPVTSLASGITYRNYACALCHGDSVDLAFWRVLVRCGNISGSATIAQVTEGLRPAGDGGWGLPVRGGRVISCSLSAQPPAEVEPRECVASQSLCPIDTDFALDELCRNHTALVYKNGRAFRNIYCLLCQNNYEEYAGSDAEPQCSIPCGEPEVPSGGRGLRVRLTLRVGTDLRCGSSDIWDPFRKICRSIVCAGAGAYLRDGVCVGGQPLEPALPTSTTPTPAEPAPPPVFSPPTAEPLPTIELDILGDEWQNIRKRLARNRALLVENRNKLIRNKDDFIRNKDTDGDRLERTLLITERRELVEIRNKLIQVRQILLEQRAQLIARAEAESARLEGTGLDAELESERRRIGMFNTRRPMTPTLMRKDPVLELNLVPKDSFMTNSEIQMETDDFKETNASSQSPDLPQQNKTKTDLEIVPKDDEEQSTEDDDIFYDVLEIEDILSNEDLDSNDIRDTALISNVDSKTGSSGENETAKYEDKIEVKDIVTRLLELVPEGKSTTSTSSPSIGVAEEQSTEEIGDARDQKVTKPDFTSSPKPESGTENLLEEPTEDYPKPSNGDDDLDITITETDQNLFRGDNKKETGNTYSKLDVNIPSRDRPITFREDGRYDGKEPFGDRVFYDSRPLPPVEDITTIGPRNLTVVSFITGQSEPDYDNQLDPEQYDYSDFDSELPSESDQRGPSPGRESDLGTRPGPTSQRRRPETGTRDDFRQPPFTVLSPSSPSGTEPSQSDRETDEYGITENSINDGRATIPTEPDLDSYSEEVATDPSFIGDREETGKADTRESDRGSITRLDNVEVQNNNRGRFELEAERGEDIEYERREDDDNIIFVPNTGSEGLYFEQNRSDDDFVSSKQNTGAENTALEPDDVRNKIKVEPTRQRGSTELDQNNRQAGVDIERDEFTPNTTPTRGRNPGAFQPNRRQGEPSSEEQNADRGEVKFTLTRPLENVTFRPFRRPANIADILKRRRQGNRPVTERQEETEARRPEAENRIDDGISTSEEAADGEQNTISETGFTRKNRVQEDSNEQTLKEFSRGPPITRGFPEGKLDSRRQNSQGISENPQEFEIGRGDAENKIDEAVSLNDQFVDREQDTISETDFTQLNRERGREPLIQITEEQEPVIRGTEPNPNAPQDRPEDPQRPPGPSTVRGPPQRKVPTNQISTPQLKTQDSPLLPEESETSTNDLSSQTQSSSSSDQSSTSRDQGSKLRTKGPTSKGGTRNSLPFFLRRRGSQNRAASQNSRTRQSNVQQQSIADDIPRPARQSRRKNSSSKRKATSASQKVHTVVKDNDYFPDRESTIRLNQPYSLVAEQSSLSNFNRKYSSRRRHHEERKRRNRQSIRNRRRNTRRDEANFQSKKIETKLHTTAAVFPTPGKDKYNRINTYHSEEDKHYLYTDDADTFRRINGPYRPQDRDDVIFASPKEGNLEAPNEPSVTPLYEVPLYVYGAPDDQELGNPYSYDARRDEVDADSDEEDAFTPQQYSDEKELKAKEYPDLVGTAKNKEYDVEYVDYNPNYNEF